MGKLSEWKKVGPPLGSGGQSDLWLVRRPQRQAEIDKGISDILDFQVKRGTVDFQDQKEHTLLFAQALKQIIRDEHPSDLGALKQFRIPEDETANSAIARLKREIEVLSKATPGLLMLLDSNEDERWIVTEYFPQGSLEKQITKFQGRALAALKAFRSLVQVVASLHSEGIVHRDIKPANVFPRHEEELVLGDFGIAYMPDAAERITGKQEKVGPRDYMPPWAPIAERLDEVKPEFDVYMLGKLLWCMVSGRIKLFREYYKRQDNDLERTFRDDPQMHLINRILDKCIVEEQERCLPNAEELLLVVDEVIGLMKKGALPLNVSRPCPVCGKGVYESQGYTGSAALIIPRYDEHDRHVGAIRLVPFVCNYCKHFEFFAPGYPEQAAKKH